MGLLEPLFIALDGAQVRGRPQDLADIAALGEILRRRST